MLPRAATKGHVQRSSSAYMEGAMARPYVAAIIAFLFGALGFAQSHPDFSGKWVMDMTRSESAALDATVAVTHLITLVISQTPARLTVDIHDGALHSQS